MMNQKIFLAGVGGTGMAALAIYLSQSGVAVSGFDDFLSSDVEFLLRRAGVELMKRPERVPEGFSQIVYSPAFRATDPLFEKSFGHGLPFLSRGEFLSKFLADRDLVVVCGSHGKTSCCGYMICLLDDAGFEFDYLLGGFFRGKRSPARFSGQRLVLFELDESDGTIEHFSPAVTVCLNMDLDHDEHYASLDALRETFFRLFSRTRRRIFLPSDLVLPAESRGWAPVAEMPLFVGESFQERDARFARIVVEELLGKKCPDREQRSIENNAIRRRGETLLETDELTVLSDFAHHPKELDFFLSGQDLSRAAIIFQPHRYSRVACHSGEFQSVFLKNLARQLILLPTYPAFEPFDEKGTGELLAARIGEKSPCSYYNKLHHVKGLAALIGPDVDKIFFIGAGSISNIARNFVHEWRREKFRKLLQENGLNEVVQEQVVLAKKTTFGIGGPVSFFASPRNFEELTTLVDCARLVTLPQFLLGRGSNFLIADEGFSGLAISLEAPFWRQISFSDGVLTCGAGVHLRRLALFCAKFGFSGLEFLGGIPGSVGGALVRNAGAFGSAIGDFVESIDCIMADGSRQQLKNLSFSYRRAVFPEGAIVLAVNFKKSALKPESKEVILGRMEDFASFRRRNQPLAQKSAGSVFKNPPGHFAGQLVELVGLRGLTVGGAQVSPIHGNFIVNRGGATAADVLTLIGRLKKVVKERFAVDLETEIEYMSDSWTGSF